MLNGGPLPSGTKFIPSFEFGVVKLVIEDALLKDAGMFKCTATNNKGIASTSGTLKVQTEGGSGVASEGLHPSGKAGLDAIQKMELEASLKLAGDKAVEEEDLHAPRFTTDLPAEVNLQSEMDLNLECCIEPKNDSTLKIDWYHNGLPLSTGTRIRATSDFGFVNLSINGMTARDAGLYTCKATNKLGEAVTFIKVNVQETAFGVDFSSQHPRGSEALNSFTGVEAKGILRDEEEKVDEIIPPRFVTNFENAELGQGSVGHFEAQLEPRNENMTLEWFLDGKPLKESKTYNNFEKLTKFK